MTNTTRVLMERGRGVPQSKCRVVTEAEIRVIQIQERQGLVVSTRSQEETKKDPPLQPTKGAWLCSHLDFERTPGGDRINVCCFT